MVTYHKGKDRKVHRYKEQKYKEREDMDLMEQVQELTIEVCQAQNERDRYKKALEAEKAISTMYKTLAQRYRVKLIYCSVTSLVLLAIVGVMTWTRY